MTIDVPAGLKDGTGSYITRRVRYRFTHCVKADARTAVSPTTWQASWADLFTSRETLQRGAIGTFKNPTSHRPVEYDDPALASEFVRLDDLLLRMLDQVEWRLAAPTGNG